MNIVLWKILTATLLANIAYGIVAPTVPLIFEQKQIPRTAVAIIFSIYNLPIVLVSPFVPMMIKRYTSHVVITFGVLLFGFVLIFMGLIEYMEDTRLIIAYILTCRLVQGFCSSLIQTTCYAVAANDFPDDKDRIIGYIEAVMGIACGLGPFFGASLYVVFGFARSFFVFGMSLLIFAYVLVKMKTETHHKFVDEEESPSREQGKVTFLGMCSVPRFFFAGFAAMIYTFSYCYFEPVTALYLEHHNGLSEFYIGVFFSVYPVFYMVGCLLIQFVPDQAARRLVIMMAAFFMAIANFLSGPSELLSFPGDSIAFMVFGQALCGISGALMTVPSLPEMIDSLKHKYPGLEEEVGIQASGMFNSILATGQIFGPLYAMGAVSLVGFRYACDIQAVAILVFCIFYFVFG